jgi:ethanolamine utilization protein EutN
MFLGKVIGTVWSTVKWPGVSGLKLLVVRPYHLADLPTGAASPAPPESHTNHEAVVCVDLLDAGVGDDVVVAFGHAARVAAKESGEPPAQGESGSRLKGPNKAVVPIDAAIVAIVDAVAVTRPST